MSITKIFKKLCMSTPEKDPTVIGHEQYVQMVYDAQRRRQQEIEERVAEEYDRSVELAKKYLNKY